MLYFVQLYVLRFTSLLLLWPILNILFHCYHITILEKSTCIHYIKNIVIFYNSRMGKWKNLDMYKKAAWFYIFMSCSRFDVLSRNSRCHFCCLILHYVLNCTNSNIHMSSFAFTTTWKDISYVDKLGLKEEVVPCFQNYPSRGQEQLTTMQILGHFCLTVILYSFHRIF